jgi:hypothetical protein
MIVSAPSSAVDEVSSTSNLGKYDERLETDAKLILIPPPDPEAHNKKPSNYRGAEGVIS